VVNERLAELLARDAWAVVAVTIRGLDGFREAYGFVASDDVLRAAAMMLNDALREMGGADDFLGHLAAEDFVMITGAGRARELRQRVQTQMTDAIAYFYPQQDRAASGQATGLQVISGVLTADDGPLADVNALKMAALRSRTA
jgi:GGDEF domain-containing protein